MKLFVAYLTCMAWVFSIYMMSILLAVAFVLSDGDINRLWVTAFAGAFSLQRMHGVGMVMADFVQKVADSYL